MFFNTGFPSRSTVKVRAKVMLHIIENFAVALWWVDSFAVASLSGCLRVLSLNRRYLSGVTVGETVVSSLCGCS